jgi:lysophospholipase L1-like esterase
MTHHSGVASRLLAAAAMLIWHRLPSEWGPNGAERLRWALGCDDIQNLDRLLSRVDGDHADQGYYNQLLDTGLRLGQSPSIAEAVAELRELVLRPNLSIVRNDGTRWSTNALGMRDQPYAAVKPSGTFRIAMTGDSIGVGLGVGDGRGFEPLLERWLDERSRRRGGPAVEILNLALPGRSPGQRWDHFQKVGWSTGPDVVLFEATAADLNWDRRRLSDLLPRGIGWDSRLYGDVLTRSGIRPGATSEAYWQALGPYRWDLLAAAYRAVADECRARGVPCVWVLIPRVGRYVEPSTHRRLVEVARAAGFTVVIDISDAFDGRDPAALAIHPSDFHPNSEGHALLARRLAEALWPLPALRRLRGPVPGATQVETEAMEHDPN